jgi:hypothetical protein
MGASSLPELKRIIESESIDGIHLLKSPQDNPICSLAYDESISCIAVVWRKYATSAQLRFIHEIILGMLTQHAADRILGDDSDLPIVHAEDQTWIVENWLPRARAAGLKAVASAVSLTFFGKVSIGSIHLRIAKEIAIRDFHNIYSARIWLGSLARQQLVLQPR